MGNEVTMKTYQDLLACGQDESKRRKFIAEAINEHTASAKYQKAQTAQLYREQKNETIEKYQKILRTVTGDIVQNPYAANHKCKSGFFKRFVIQRTQYLLGNGAQFRKKANKKKLGENFDTVLQDALDCAITQGESFLFWDLDKVICFAFLEFVPLYDEQTGALRAGIRFWQIDEHKPQYITLYEEDGVTGYVKQEAKELEEIAPKRGYRKITTKAPADPVGIDTYENYASFPVVPLKHNKQSESLMEGLREQIDAYDLIKSGFANDLDDTSLIFWIVENAGGMDDIDIAKFLERLHRLHTAVVDGDDGAKATPHAMDVPYEARKVSLDRIRADLFEDAMALDVERMAGGEVKATQIRAAYEALNGACDRLEYQIIDTVTKLQAIAGLEPETPTFERSQIINMLEITEMVLMAAAYLDDETIIDKLPFLSSDEKAHAKLALKNKEIQRSGITGGMGGGNANDPAANDGGAQTEA